jgi:hypothetical protein
MAFVRMAFFPGGTEEHYLALAEEMKFAPHPAGRHLFAAGPVRDGWQVVQLWSRKDQLDAFNAEWFIPALQRTTLSFPAPPQVVDFETFVLDFGEP